MIVLLDPSLKNNKNEHSINLGDIIIRESVAKVLNEIFPNQEIYRISTHQYLSKKEYDIISESKYTFIGGSNLLSSNIVSYNQWKVSNNLSLYFLFPKLKNVILLGVGWWQYQNNPDYFTKNFYTKVFSHKYQHSVRDSYTKEKLNTIGLNNIINTTCPTLWDLNKVSSNRNHFETREVIFTLTDYNKSPKSDNNLLALLSDRFDKLYFFAQGSKDEAYIKTLEKYKLNKENIKILNSIEAYKDCLAEKNKLYIGTRLHGGIQALKYGLDSLILAIDNRAREISKDTNLAVIQREDSEKINNWLDGKLKFGTIQLNDTAINNWKKQFK